MSVSANFARCIAKALAAWPHRLFLSVLLVDSRLVDAIRWCPFLILLYQAWCEIIVCTACEIECIDGKNNTGIHQMETTRVGSVLTGTEGGHPARREQKCGRDVSALPDVVSISHALLRRLLLCCCV